MTKTQLNFIIDRMIDEELMVAAVCKKYHKQGLCPSYRTVMRHQVHNPKVKAAISEAYECLVDLWAVELDRVSNTPASELYPDLDFKERSEARRARIDALKFMLAKIGGILSRRWQQKQVVEHQDNRPEPVDYSKMKFEDFDKEEKH